MEGLSQPELFVLAVVAGSATLPEWGVSLYSVKDDVERAGLTNIGFSLGVRRLRAKQFIEITKEEDHHGEPYQVLSVTEAGWAWIESNESKFVMHRPKKLSPDVDDIPF